MYGQLMAQFTSSRPSIKREPNMKLEGGERLVLKTLADLQGNSTHYVDRNINWLCLSISLAGSPQRAS